jgi:amino acid adenylation domain-containing protein
LIYQNQTIQELFKRTVAEYPDQVAVTFEQQNITYSELDAKSNQFANYLRERYVVKQGDFVGIKLLRTDNLIMSLLGTLKSGAVYVPIDPNYPQSRIEFIQKDSDCEVIIDDSVISDFEKQRQRYNQNDVNIAVDPNAIAYIIYTSGTTGEPKGVTISHRNAVAMLKWAKIEFEKDPIQTVYAVTSHCFDLSIFEIFFPLTNGLKVRILRSVLDVGLWLDQDSKVLLNMVPSAFKALVAASVSLTNVVSVNLAGEVFPTSIVELLNANGINARNLYGPSEDTTYSTCYKLQRGNYKSIPIGKAITNTRALVLDNKLELVPFGVEGYLYLSGDGVATGYLNRPELTNAKFLECPYLPDEIMYNTGDLVKWLPSGELHYIGRSDNQLKLNGYRIELGEIEAVIASFSETIEDVTVIPKLINSNHQLIAYYVSDASINEETLRDFLSSKLPAYMVPSIFKELETMPLTPNGKIDKNVLSDIVEITKKFTDFIEPDTNTEMGLAMVWSKILGVEKIGKKDNFFLLGGHSLKLTILTNEIYKQFNVKIGAGDLFQNQVLENQAQIIENLKLQNSIQSNKDSNNSSEVEKFVL